MAGHQPFAKLTDGLPPEPSEKIVSKVAPPSERQNGSGRELDENYIREREAVLDELVAEAQKDEKHDMGYNRS